MIDFIAVGLGGAVLAVWLRTELRRIEIRLCGPDDFEHDRQIDQQIDAATKPYRSRLENLEQEKQRLPRSDLWELSSNSDWEQQLIAGAEKLRYLVAEVHGHTPDSHFVSREADRMPMSYELADALVNLATLEKDLNAAAAEWAIKKIELLGLMRKREATLQAIAEADRELHETEREIEELRRRLPSFRREVLEAFHRREAVA